MPPGSALPQGGGRNKGKTLAPTHTRGRESPGLDWILVGRGGGGELLIVNEYEEKDLGIQD